MLLKPNNKSMKVLLVEPAYYTKYPPLGLMKLSSYYKSRACDVKLVRGIEKKMDYDADIIEITSLFTYSWKPVHDAIKFYNKEIPDSKINVGGIYASMMPERIRTYFPDINIHVGLHDGAEKYMPDYDIIKKTDKWKDWDSSILFTSRGCIRKCPYCIVPKMEGKIKAVINDLRSYIYPYHKKVIIWDNNFFASPNWKIVLGQLIELGLKVDFNQGLDARLLNQEKAEMLAELKPPIIRLAYDSSDEKKSAHKATELLEEQGIRRRNILFYTLYNFHQPNYSHSDSPDTFLEIIKDIAEMGCISYPMRYEPLDSLKKNQFISPYWTSDKLELVADARRVIGFGGAFPPYKGLVEKFISADNFEQAFELRPQNKNVVEKYHENTLMDSKVEISSKTLTPEMPSN